MVFREEKGQGALEYLLMIAAALAIIAVVAYYLRSKATAAGQTANVAKGRATQELQQILQEAQYTGNLSEPGMGLAGLLAAGGLGAARYLRR